MTTDITVMIFRIWSDGDVIALMPELPTDERGWYCTSYQHVGQHGTASTGLVVAHTRPATLKESKPLVRELKALGYKIKMCLRESPKMRDRRMRTASETAWSERVWYANKGLSVVKNDDKS